METYVLPLLEGRVNGPGPGHGPLGFATIHCTGHYIDPLKTHPGPNVCKYANPIITLPPQYMF